MDIKSMEIKNILGGHLKGDAEALRHIKTLPCLSVVQPTHGYYEIGLEEKPLRTAEEGGAFVTPTGARQNIIHHNGANGYMEAQWVFMNITVNDFLDFEDAFDIPLLLSSEYSEKLFEPIFTVRSSADICRKYAAAYRLVDIIIAHASMKDTFFDSAAVLLKRFVAEHYGERISTEELANAAACSAPNLYRIFQKNFHLSPRNYINKIRIEKASVLLESSAYSVAEIAEAVGFDDPVYFSKLFKKTYLLSPQKYREALPQANTGRKKILL